MTDIDGEPAFRSYLALFRRRRWWVAAGAGLGLAASLAYSFTAHKEYTATAQILVQSATDASTPGAPQAPVSQTDVETELALVTSAPVARAVLRELSSVPVVSASQVGLTNVIAITAVSGAPARAARIANTYARAFVAYRQDAASQNITAAESEVRRQVSNLARQLRRLQGAPASSPQVQALLNQEAVLKEQLAQMQVSGVVEIGGVELVTPAQAPGSPSSPRPLRNGALGLIGGLLAGIAAAFLRDTLDDRLSSEHAAEQAARAPVLGMAPQVAAWRRRERPLVVSLTEPTSPSAEAYRSLRTSLEFIRQERQLRSLVVTSPAASEGKTTTLANLGVVFAQTGERVLVVSCDLRRPRIGQFFGIDEERGLTSVLIGELALEDVIVPAVHVDRLWVLPAGRVPPNPAELLNGKRTRQIFATLRDEFDFMLVDSPPVLPVTDAVVLSQHFDATLMVVAAGQTRRGDLRRAAERLDQVNATVVGTVLNQVTKQTGYGYGYGYGYQPYLGAAPSVNGAGRANGRAAIFSSTRG